jgi:hypothetical protein
MDGRGIDWFPTGRSRPDVDAVFGIGGKHGFNISFQSPPGPQRIDIYAINVGPATDNPYIASRTVTVS